LGVPFWDRGPKRYAEKKKFFYFFPDERAADGERLVIETD
jgi:hypothetical protein